MPVDYSQGKIYKIVGNGKIYVGSTCERLLSQRFSQHNRNFKKWLSGKDHFTTSFECLSDPECYIELLEACPCNTIDELHKCEGEWIRELDCVNRCIAGRTRQERYDEERDKILEKMRIYREANKETINAKQREYYRVNKEEYHKKMSAYREANREVIAEKQRAYRQKKKAEKSIPDLGEI